VIVARYNRSPSSSWCFPKGYASGSSRSRCRFWWRGRDFRSHDPHRSALTPTAAGVLTLNVRLASGSNVRRHSGWRTGGTLRRGRREGSRCWVVSGREPRRFVAWRGVGVWLASHASVPLACLTMTGAGWIASTESSVAV